MANIEPEIVSAILLLAATGAVVSVIVSLFISSRSSVIGSALIGAIGGIALGAILRIVGADPIVDAGEGFSYVYAGIGGLVLGAAVAWSNR